MAIRQGHEGLESGVHEKDSSQEQYVYVCAEKMTAWATARPCLKQKTSISKSLRKGGTVAQWQRAQQGPDFIPSTTK